MEAIFSPRHTKWTREDMKVLINSDVQRRWEESEWPNGTDFISSRSRSLISSQMIPTDEQSSREMFSLIFRDTLHCSIYFLPCQVIEWLLMDSNLFLLLLLLLAHSLRAKILGQRFFLFFCKSKNFRRMKKVFTPVARHDAYESASIICLPMNRTE